MRQVCDHDLDESLPALIVTYGNTTRKHRPLDREVLLLGRGPRCDLALVSPEVAPVHCVLSRGQAGWSIRDCGSRAGTHVNGEPIEAALLRDGDTVQIGPFCFRAHLPAGSAMSGPAGDDRQVLHLRRSRRNLALLALALRRRLRIGEGQAKRLAADREALERESNELLELMLQAEHELTQRQAEQTRCLDLRRRELAHYARHLRRSQERLRRREEELDPQRPRPRSDAPHFLERNSLGLPAVRW